MRVSIKKWGNSAAVRLPATLLQALHLQVDSEVDVCERAGHIIITPVQQAYTLPDLLKQITAENCHHEVNTGKPCGNGAVCS